MAWAGGRRGRDALGNWSGRFTTRFRSGTGVIVYRHLDIEHLHWGLEQAGERAALIVSDSVFS